MSNFTTPEFAQMVEQMAKAKDVSFLKGTIDMMTACIQVLNGVKDQHEQLKVDYAKLKQQNNQLEDQGKLHVKIIASLKQKTLSQKVNLSVVKGEAGKVKVQCSKIKQLTATYSEIITNNISKLSSSLQSYFKITQPQEFGNTIKKLEKQIADLNAKHQKEKVRAVSKQVSDNEESTQSYISRSMFKKLNSEPDLQKLNDAALPGGERDSVSQARDQVEVKKQGQIVGKAGNFFRNITTKIADFIEDATTAEDVGIQMQPQTTIPVIKDTDGRIDLGTLYIGGIQPLTYKFRLEFTDFEAKKYLSMLFHNKYPFLSIDFQFKGKDQTFVTFEVWNMAQLIQQLVPLEITLQAKVFHQVEQVVVCHFKVYYKIAPTVVGYDKNFIRNVNLSDLDIRRINNQNFILITKDIQLLESKHDSLPQIFRQLKQKLQQQLFDNTLKLGDLFIAQPPTLEAQLFVDLLRYYPIAQSDFQLIKTVTKPNQIIDCVNKIQEGALKFFCEFIIGLKTTTKRLDAKLESVSEILFWEPGYDKFLKCLLNFQ